MLALSIPASANSDDTTLTDICEDLAFASMQAAWQARYDLYRRKRGNEFGIKQMPTNPVIHKKQVALYKNRKSNATFTAVRETTVVCCPMCGSPGTGHLDHHLPEGRFGEFAVMIANLVPCCGHCNSGAKRVVGVGSVWPERFLHPYYDRFARNALWRVRVPDPVVPQFKPEAEPGLPPRLTLMVRYNLANLLEWQFKMQLSCYWTRIPALLRDMSGHGIVASDEELDRLFTAQYFAVTTTEGLNGWKAALLRGTRYDPTVRRHFAAAAAALPRPI